MAKGTIDDLVKAVDKLESLVEKNERCNNRKRLETNDPASKKEFSTPLHACMQKAIDNFDQVEPILKKIDFEPVRKLWEKWATKEHIRLLKKNKSLFNRVPTIKALTDEKMKAQSLIFAMGIAKILGDIKEGETHIYGGLKISKENGEIVVEKEA